MFHIADGSYLGKLDPEKFNSISHLEFTNNNKVILQGSQGQQKIIIKEDWNPQFVENITVNYGDELLGLTMTNDTTIYRTEPYILRELNKRYNITVLSNPNNVYDIQSNIPKLYPNPS